MDTTTETTPAPIPTAKYTVVVTSLDGTQTDSAVRDLTADQYAQAQALVGKKVIGNVILTSITPV